MKYSDLVESITAKYGVAGGIVKAVLTEECTKLQGIHLKEVNSKMASDTIEKRHSVIVTFHPTKTQWEGITESNVIENDSGQDNDIFLDVEISGIIMG